MIPKRRAAAIGFGLAGLAAGTLAALTQSRWLSFVAGACSLAAGGTAAWPVPAPSGPPGPAAAGARAGAGAGGAAGGAASGGPPSNLLGSPPRAPAAASPAPSSGVPAVVSGPAGGAPAPFVDAETGLYDDDWFHTFVEARVNVARRQLRPIAVVLFAVTDAGGRGNIDPAAVTATIRGTLREADTACRLADGRFGFVLEDTSEAGAILTVERLRQAIVNAGLSGRHRAGVACYPAHAFSAEEVLVKARAAYDAAWDWPHGRTEVARADS
jgi:hypothetical protein